MTGQLTVFIRRGSADLSPGITAQGWWNTAKTPVEIDRLQGLLQEVQLDVEDQGEGEGWVENHHLTLNY